MKMKTVGVALIALLLSAVPLSAQTFLTTTTLSNAITTSSQTSVVLLAATTADVGGYLYIDHEAMQINSISGTTLTVSRGQQGTAAAPHAGGTTGATVIIVPKAALAGQGPYGLSVISQNDPPSGSCTTGAYRFLPIINVVTGNVWSCRWVGSGTLTAKVWAATNIVSVNGQTSLIVQ